MNQTVTCILCSWPLEVKLVEVVGGISFEGIVLGAFTETDTTKERESDEVCKSPK